MSKYIIQGGKQLSGTISVVSGKNATIALFFASLLLKGKVLFKDVTKVAEVFRVLEILESIGVRYEWMSENSLLIDTSKKLTMATLDKKASASTRISLLLLGGLASREKTYKIYRTGGCKLGKRTVGPHLYALQKLGISIDSQKGHYLVKNKKLYLGGIKIPYHSGLKGHSDGDVILHAIIDALLGAMRKKDIGAFFPDNKNKFKNIRSPKMLKPIIEILNNNNFYIYKISYRVCLI